MRLKTALFGFLSAAVSATALDLRTAHIEVQGTLTGPEKKAVEMLSLEVEARTGLNWRLPNSKGPAITIHHAKGSGPAEGFRVQVHAGTADIQGNDERGTLFGVGRFLREMHWAHGAAEIADAIDITASPRYPLRGHQVGYRPKVNTYDAWTPANFEQYVRDLAVFGTNAIELIPPRSDDADDSPHFHLSKIDMMVEMSRIIAEYGLQVWIWYPAMDRDYTDPKTVEFALREWGEVFQKLPRIDAVFVPGGDPGDTAPKALLSLLEKESAVLRRSHPHAQMWVSPQGFDGKDLDQFVDLVKREPAWLNGIVYGPWTRVSPEELRAKIPSRYPMRLYPDITHSLHCEYPVPDWDTAYAVTEAREIINPRPVDHSRIFRHVSPTSIGFITYSEGVNDDVNKILWSALGWDPEADMGQVLREFGRYFISPAFDDGIAQALIALERNWRGPLAANAGVDETFRQVQALEHAASPQMLLNWRFQQILYRAYYDEYVRQRLIHETALEKQAMDRLAEAGRTGAKDAIDAAGRILDRSGSEPVARELRSRLFALAEALYQSIHMQLSVERYKAIAVNRGANLDTVDFPLNDRFWLKKQFAQVREMGTEQERMAGIEKILNRTDAGPGGFYDDLGNPSLQPHLVQEGPGFAKDPGGFHSVRANYQALPTRFVDTPVAWWNYAESRHETPLVMRYEHLDSRARYRVRVVYLGNPKGPKVRLSANDGLEVHPFVARPSQAGPLEFDIPAEATRAGSLTLRWFVEPGGGGSSAAVQIAEVFLIRK